MRFVKKILIWASVTYAILVAMLTLLENKIIYPATKFPIGIWKESAQRSFMSYR